MERTTSFGYWLRRRRKALDLTQEQLARQVGCAVGTIKKLEADERRPSRQFAERLADLLQLPPEERAAFLKAARAELAVDELEVAAQPIQSPAPAAPPTALDRPLSNLLVPQTTLIGREREVAGVCALLRRSDVRLLMLTGPGGTGKTRLSLQVAADLLADDSPPLPSQWKKGAGGEGLQGEGRFPHGVWFVDLAPTRDVEQVLPAIAQVLGVTNVGEQPLALRLVSFLRDRRLLLLLDNFEQVAAAGPLIAELLARAPGVKALVTSREALHLYGEHEYAVPPLTLPDLHHLPALERLTQYEAVQLFLERAQAVKTDFAMTNENAPAVAEICYRLDGLPLAIELAAARVRLFPPNELLARLGSRLELLVGGPRNLPARQQTLRATLTWSYDLLSAKEQVLFARLSVFAGGFTLAAAEQVCGNHFRDERARESLGPSRRNQLAELEGWWKQAPPCQAVLVTDEVAELLESLIGKSLVRQGEVAGHARFTLLETIREYALHRLHASGEEEALRWRHARFYSGCMLWAEVSYNPRGLQDVKRELENLRAVMDWSVRSGEALPGLIITSVNELWGDYANEALGWLDALLAHEPPESHPLAHALYSYWYLHGTTKSLGWAGTRPTLEAYYRVIARLNPAELPGQDWAFGFVDLAEGKLDAARARFERFAEWERSLDDPIWRPPAAALGLATYWMVAGDAGTAYTYYEQALDRSRKRNSSIYVVKMLHKLGFAAQQQGDLVRATAHLRESLELARELDYQRAIAEVLAGFAGVALSSGELERAARLCGAVEALQEQTTGFDLEQNIVHQRNLAALRAQLDPAMLEACWAAGRALDWDQAIAEALAVAGTMKERGR